MKVYRCASRKQGRSRPGFTLVELMIATTLLVVAIGMGTGLFIELMRSFWVSKQKNVINGEVRKMNSMMINEARQANEIIAYETFAFDHRNQQSDRLGPTESGDLLILVFLNSPEDYALESLTSPGTARRRIEKVVGYYRLAPEYDDYFAGAFEGPLVRFERWVPATNQTDDLETIINNFCQDIESNPSSGVEHTAVIGGGGDTTTSMDYLEGLAKGRLFYVYSNGSIMVNGKITHGSQAKMVTNTYNFTISPRG